MGGFWGNCIFKGHRCILPVSHVAGTLSPKHDRDRTHVVRRLEKCIYRFEIITLYVVWTPRARKCTRKLANIDRLIRLKILIRSVKQWKSSINSKRSSWNYRYITVRFGVNTQNTRNDMRNVKLKYRYTDMVDILFAFKCVCLNTKVRKICITHYTENAVEKKIWFVISKRTDLKIYLRTFHCLHK